MVEQVKGVRLKRQLFRFTHTHTFAQRQIPGVPASLKAVTGFGTLDPNTLANTAHHVAKGVGGNPVYFPNPPIDPASLDASANTLSEAVLAAMDGNGNFCGFIASSASAGTWRLPSNGIGSTGWVQMLRQ
jgi:hypothetical protein